MASYINSGDLGDDFETSGSLFGLLIVNFVHLEVVFRPVKGEIQHWFRIRGLWESIFGVYKVGKYKDFSKNVFIEYTGRS